MGCEQSSERKVTPEPSRWSSRVLPPGIQTEVKAAEKVEKLKDEETKVKPMVNLANSEKIVELLLEYQEKEEEIDMIEKGEPLTMFYIKKAHLETISKRIQEQQDKIAILENSEGTNEVGNNSKPTTVKNALLMLGDKKLNKEDHKLLADINNLEIALTELEMAHQEKALMENEVRNLHSTLLNLREAYRQLDDILSKLGMNEETQEETLIHSQLADMESRRMNISEMYERWKEGRIQIYESCRQMSTALTKWRNLPADSVNHMDEYDVGEDIRDDLVNAVQCLGNVKFYIRLELPYCSPGEVAVLEKALTYLFIDLRSHERREHAELCYAAIHKRAVALFAWIDKTIELVIEPELSSLTRVINEKANQLKSIRKQEIKTKYPGIEVSDRISNAHPTHLFDMDIQSSFSSLDPETDKVFNELEFDQLALLPSIEEISMRNTHSAQDLIETFRIELREELALDDRNYNSNSKGKGDTDEITTTHRTNTFSRKLLLIQDSFG